VLGDGSLSPTAPPRALLAELAEEERLRLFAWTNYQEHRRYLAVLRALDRLRESYVPQARPIDVAEALAAGEPSPPSGGSPRPPNHVTSSFVSGEAGFEGLVRTLDQLAEDQVLERSQDTARVTSIAEYRRRRPVFQFTELGYKAFRLVDDLLHFRPGDASLRRFALAAIAEDLAGLAQANLAGGATRVHRLLHQLDLVFTDMAEQAAAFYVLLGQLTQQHEAQPEVFVELKDRLLLYLREFLSELQRCRPLVAGAIGEVEATGLDQLVERAAEADDAPFLTPVERRQRWRSRWDGLARWFVGDGSHAAAAAELDRATTRAIADLAALLRRLTEMRSRGISRATEFDHLARWFAAVPSDDAAHALFSAALGLAPARHLGLGADVADRDPPSSSWWEGQPVPVAASLRERGKPPLPGPPAPVPDHSGTRHLARRMHDEQRQTVQAAVTTLGREGVADRVLDPAELRVVLRLLGLALRGRTPTSAGSELQGRDGPLRIRLVPGDRDAVVKTALGVLTLPGFDLEVRPA
jgi:uncharacterized protein (TIGR02677 family)